jgi:hypothetical protein
VKEARATSRKDMWDLTLFNKFTLDTETGETIVTVSKTSESLSIRASSLEGVSGSLTDKTTGLASHCEEYLISGEKTDLVRS